MRITALLGCAMLVAACSTKETPAVSDTTTAAVPPAAAPVTFASFSGKWNILVKPEGQDTVVTSYLLDTTDSTKVTFTFPDGRPVPVRITAISGDTLVAET